MDRTASLHALTIAAGLFIAWRVITKNAVVYDEGRSGFHDEQRIAHWPRSCSDFCGATPEVAALVALAQNASARRGPGPPGAARGRALRPRPVDRDVSAGRELSLRQGRTGGGSSSTARGELRPYAGVPGVRTVAGGTRSCGRAVAARNQPGWAHS
jgi:hypothetical protein